MKRQKRNKKIILGITGTFGSGKSTVAAIFASYGGKVIDADKIAHNCLKRGRAVYKKIILVFGTEITGKNKEINRKKLAQLVFGDEALLRRLEKIVHPEVIRIIKQKIGAIKKGVIILDAPLLLEAGLMKQVDKLVVVNIDNGARIKRLCKKSRFKKADIAKRMKFQISQKKKSVLANFIIDNSGSLSNTRKQVVEIRRNLWKS